MKKSLLITADFPPIIGGVSTYLYNIWRCLAPEETLILAPTARGGQGFDQEEHLRIFRRRLPLGDSLIRRLLRTVFFVFYLFPILRKERPDVLVCGHPVSAGFVGLLYKVWLKIPYCVFVHGGELLQYQKSRIISKLTALALVNADGIFANSEYTKNEYQCFHPRQGFLERLNPGVDTDKFNPNVKTEQLRERLKLKDKRVILTVSRLVERKNHILVINILPRLLQEVPNLIYIIVGKGPMEAVLRKEVARLNLEPDVIFAGDVSNEELAQYYNLCELHIMLSRRMRAVGDIEGFGISFVEASSCVKPVVGGKSGGIGDAITEGISGVLVDPCNEDEIFKTVLKILSDKEYARRLGRAGRQIALARFDSRVVAARFKKLLEQIKSR